MIRIPRHVRRGSWRRALLHDQPRLGWPADVRLETPEGSIFLARRDPNHFENRKRYRSSGRWSTASRCAQHAPRPLPSQASHLDAQGCGTAKWDLDTTAILCATFWARSLRSSTCGPSKLMVAEQWNEILPEKPPGYAPQRRAVSATAPGALMPLPSDGLPARRAPRRDEAPNALAPAMPEPSSVRCLRLSCQRDRLHRGSPWYNRSHKDRQT